MNLKLGLEKAFIIVAVFLLALSCLPLNAHAASGSSSVEAALFRSPETVLSGQASLIFAHVPKSFSEMHLSTTVTLTLKRSGSTLFSKLVAVNLPLVAVPWVSGWYVTSIPGLPAYTLKGVLEDWKVSTRVDYTLVIDGASVASGSCDVVEKPEKIREIIGVMQQHISLDRDLTVREDIELCVRLHHFAFSERERLVAEFLEYVGLLNMLTGP